MKIPTSFNPDLAAKWCTIFGLPLGLLSFMWSMAHSSPAPTPLVAQPPSTIVHVPSAKSSQVTEHSIRQHPASSSKNQPNDSAEQTDFWHPHHSPLYEAFISTLFYVTFFYSFTIFVLACFGLDFNPKSRHIYRNIFAVSVVIVLVILGGNVLRQPWANW